MKYFILMILIFTSTRCCVIDQKLIDGAEKYDVATVVLSKLVHARIAANMPLGEWMAELHKTTDDSLSDSDRKLARNKIDDADKKWNDLNAQIVVAEEVVKKYEPIKDEYDRQLSREKEVKDTIQNIATILLILSIFASFFWFIIYQQKKYKRLLEAGKITQEEYDQMTKSSHTFSDNGVNPSTGLPMTGIGISDVGGNIRGSSSSSSFNASQHYVDNCKW
jgi:hypothetical protein